MTHWSECPGFLVDALLFGDPLEQIPRNELAELLKNSGIELGCLGYHNLGISHDKDRRQPNFHHYGTLLIDQYSLPYGNNRI